MADVTQQMLEGGSWGSAQGAGARSGLLDGHDLDLRRDRLVSTYSPRGLAGVARTIEADVIPRLVLAHRNLPKGIEAVGADNPAFSEEVVAFAEIILHQDVSDACDHVEALRASGTPLEVIYLSLLAPAAGYLRYLAAEDFCDFADFTLGLWRLQQVLREFSTAFRAESMHAESGLSALLVPSPGEKPELGYLMFGLVLVGEFFRREGWGTWIEPDASGATFAAEVRNHWFDVVQFMATGDRGLDALASSIRTARRESPNRALGIVLCGKVFVEHPELVLVVGGDMTASDPRQGVLQAHNLVGLLTSRG